MPMDPPKVNQRFLNSLAKPVDMPEGVPWVQWRVENVEEMYRFLEDEIANKFDVQVRMVNIPGHQVLIQTTVLTGDLQISPGDCLVVAFDEQRQVPRLGVVRAKESVAFREADGLRDHDNKRFLDPQDGKITHGILN